MAVKDSNNRLVAHGHKIDTTGDSALLVGEFSEFLQVEVREDSAVKLSPTRSSDAEKITLAATDDDVVELTLEDGLQLFTSMERLQKEIIPQDQQRGGGSNDLTIPRQLVFTNQHSRGPDGLTVEAIRLLDVKGKLVDHVTGKVAALTARKLAEMMEAKLVGDGSLIRISNAEILARMIQPSRRFHLQTSTHPGPSSCFCTARHQALPAAFPNSGHAPMMTPGTRLRNITAITSWPCSIVHSPRARLIMP